MSDTKMRINKIELQNYRQYRQIKIDFLTEKNNDFHILIAQNGTGKTTLLNAITWCLYGKEKHLSNEEKALQIPNDKIISGSLNEDNIKVVVMIEIEYENNIIRFLRDKDFKVLKNNNNVGIVPGRDSFSATLLPKNSFKNPAIFIGEQADTIVKQYFNSEISEYYFFDGEKLSEYLNNSKNDTVKQAVFNISQVTLLDNSLNRTTQLADEKRRSIKDVSSGMQVLIRDKENLQKDNNSLVNMLVTNREKLSILENEKKSIDDTLHNYQPIKIYHEQRLEYELQVKQNERRKEEIEKEKNSFVRKYYILLKFYPLIKNTHDMILTKERMGTLPPEIDKRQIKQILEDEYCTICQSHITDDGKRHLMELLDKIAVSSKTSNYLKEIKSSLENYVYEAKSYITRKKEILNKEMSNKSEWDKLTSKLNEIHSYLAKYNTTDTKANISDLEARRESITNQIISLKAANQSNSNLIEANSREINRLEKEIARIEIKEHENNVLLHEVRLLRNITDYLSIIKNKIMADIKSTIQQYTWDFFNAMTWKKYSFSSLTIDDMYKISVFNKDGRDLTGSLGATEQMALAYAFTLGIHKASGQNCPLVVDSPLGRASDLSRINMSQELLKVSSNKQIIMFFTPDEFSVDVQKTFSGVASSIRRMKLSEDETEISTISLEDQYAN